MGQRTETTRTISKAEFYASGAFSNPALLRVTRKGRWAYLRVTRNY